MAETDSLVQYIPPEALREETFSEEEQGILAQVNEYVAAQRTVEELVDFLFATTRSVCVCDRISVAFLEDDNRRVVSHYARATYEPLVLKEGYAADLRGSSLEEVFRTGAPRIIPDLEAYLQAHPESVSTKLLLREGVRSNMTCPLAVDGRRVGFLFRSAREADAYGRHQAAMHLAVSRRLSQAVEKAWLIQQLRRANRNYLEMLGFVSHELKNPLGSLIMSGDLITDGYLGEVPPKVAEKVETMKGKAEYLMALVKDYLDLARLESGELTVEPAELDLVAEVVEPAVEVVAEQIEERGVRLERDFPDAPPRLEGDADLLKIVAVNLLSNAVKYGNEGGRVRCTVTAEDESVRLAVWNEGPGFPPAEKHRLFRRFSRLKSEPLRKRKGSGLGLYTAWRIVQEHGGTIRAESEEGSWARFVVELPRRAAGAS
jgi:signal transduction histidine kinase